MRVGLYLYPVESLFMRVFVLVICFLFADVAHSQNQQVVVDSLLERSQDTKLSPELRKTSSRQALKTALAIHYVEGQVRAHMNLGAVAAQEGQLDTATQHFKRAALLAQKENLTGELGNAHNNTGLMFNAKGQMDSAIHYFRLAQTAFASSSKFYYRAAHLSQNLGTYYHQSGNYPQALEEYLNALRLFNQLQSTKDQAVVYNNVGLVFLALKEYPKAETNLYQSKRLWLKLQDSLSLANVFDNLGLTRLRQGDQDSATYYFETALAINQNQSNKSRMANNYRHLADVCTEQLKFSKARTYYQQALVIYRGQNKAERLVKTQLSLGRLHLKQNQRDSALHFGKIGGKIADSLGLKPLVYQSKLLVLRTQLTKPQDSTLLVDLLNWHDSLFADEKIQALKDAEARYETDKVKWLLEQEKQQLALERERAKQQTIILSAISLFLVLFLVGIIFWRHQKSKTKQQVLQQTIELKASALVDRQQEYAQLEQEFQAIKANQNLQPTEKLDSMGKLLQLKLNNKESRLQFIKDISLVYPNAASLQAKYPKLTPQLRVLLILEAFPFEDEQRSQIMGPQIKSITKYRTRLREALGLHKNDNLMDAAQEILNIDSASIS